MKRMKKKIRKEKMNQVMKTETEIYGAGDEQKTEKML